MTDKNPVIMPLQQWRKKHPQGNAETHIIPMRAAKPDGVFVCSMSTGDALHPDDILKNIATFIDNRKTMAVPYRLIIDMTHVGFVNPDLFLGLVKAKQNLANRGTLIIAGIDVPEEGKKVYPNNTDQIGLNSALNETLRFTNTQDQFTFCRTVDEAVSAELSSRNRVG